METTLSVSDVQALGNKILANLEKVIVGKRQVLEFTLIGLMCQGQILIEDVPGVGKTMLARALAKSLGCTFNRIQFTPDMLPSDVTGVSMFNQVTRDFEYRPGPIMAQVILTDEINRATPKDSIRIAGGDGRTAGYGGWGDLSLPRPFLVMATQNPIEYEGTFPLPEAQLDRFLLRIRLGYPNMDDEIKIMADQQFTHPINIIEPVVSVDELTQMQESVKNVFVSPAVKRYIVELTRATRENQDVYLGASPRGSLGLFRAGQVRAAIEGRDYVLPDDIKALADFVLSHRIVINPAARLKNLTSAQIVKEIVHNLPVPGGLLSKS